MRKVELAPTRGLWRKLTQGMALTLSLTLTGLPAIPAFQDSAKAAGNARTISMYFVHTKESIKVTYKRGGRYDAAALKKINYFLRDWRAKEPTRMDPKLIDLLWELHTELGSKKPVHVISAFRSSRTNKMLKRIGRNVARRSMHIQGKAIDVYFPDVKVKRLRESALLRERGGVGYYPRSGKHGFVHIDTGNVRHWPRMSKQQLAKLFRNKKRRKAPARASSVLVAGNTQPASERSTLRVPLVSKPKAASVKIAKARTAPPKTRSTKIAAVKRARIPRPRFNPNRDTDIQIDSNQRKTIVAQALRAAPLPPSRPTAQTEAPIELAEAPIEVAEAPIELAEAPLPVPPIQTAELAPQIQEALDRTAVDRTAFDSATLGSTAELDEPVSVPLQQEYSVPNVPAPPSLDLPKAPEPVAPVLTASALPDFDPVIIEPASTSPVRTPTNVVAELTSPVDDGLRVGSNSRVVGASTSTGVEIPGKKNRSFWRSLFPSWFSDDADESPAPPVARTGGTRVASLKPDTITDNAAHDITTASIGNSSTHEKAPIVNRPGKTDRLYAVPLAQLAVIELPGNRRILMNRGNKADSLVPVQDRELLGAPRASNSVRPFAQTPQLIGSRLDGASGRTENNVALRDTVAIDGLSINAASANAVAAVTNDTTSSPLAAAPGAKIVSSPVPRPQDNPKRGAREVETDPILKLFQ